MGDEPLSGDDLDRIRHGDVAPNPCGGCGVVPVWREEDAMYHFFHHEGCEVVERINKLVNEG